MLIIMAAVMLAVAVAGAGALYYQPLRGRVYVIDEGSNEVRGGIGDRSQGIIRLDHVSSARVSGRTSNTTTNSSSGAGITPVDS
mmetsp:Transcript_11066/g.22614  ORF Transcript_11066/g.22614 Transcript_11066/m.22614 type:complete len:84 (+) Transcript_11066:373-624(+)